MELHSGLPYWVVKNQLFDYYNPLRKDISEDIVIIGAGITGALMAHELCKAGRKCCVVDRRSIATGSSAASTALLQYEIDVPLYKMAEMMGEESAVMAYRACMQSISDLDRELRACDVDADFEQLPSIFYASDAEGEDIITKEFEIRRRNGFPVRKLCKEVLFHKYGLQTYGSALMNRESAQVDAYKAATGLFRFHMEHDALQIFTHTEITDCKETGSGYELRTNRGYVIRCNYVIVAAGFEAGRFLPQKVMKLTSTYALISHPVDSEDLWPERSLIWETAEPYLYIRTSGGNRIIVGGEDEEFYDPEYRDELLREKISVLENKFRKLLPTVPFETEMAWCGTFSTTKDGLPFIGTWPGRERMFFDLGYGGNGITFSVIGARLISRKLSGLEDDQEEIFGFERLKKIACPV